MRYVRLVFMFLAVAAALVAADPFVGAWKLNPAKSKFKTGVAPKEQTVTIARVSIARRYVLTKLPLSGRR
jgi:hypothetical protein